MYIERSLDENPPQLRTAIETRVKDGPQEMDMLGWMGRTALELIGQGGFGHSFDPIVSEPTDKFAEAVKSFMCVTVTWTFHQTLFTDSEPPR